ncbi:MAG TPA: FtsX-like permease family protein, partial [Candidatus Limnocylindrales bacterium]|nr:FtsX-like permease family protein [Candidatus Limnocylindrales bacterium]
WLPHSALVPLLGFPVERLRSPRSTLHSRLLALPRPGVAPGAVEQQVADILSRLGEAAPERAAEYARIMPTMTMGFHAPPTGRERAESMLIMMGWAAALLLVIACANVANLLLFQNLARRGALATMRAIGASGGRIARQDLIRSLLLAALGVGAGAGVGWGVARLFRGQLLSGMPEFEGLRLDDPGLLLWVGGAVLATTVLFGVAPAVLAGRFDLSVALASSRTRETGRLGPLRTALSAGQIALTLSLLVGGLLMVRTLMNFARVDTGVDVEGIVAATFDLPSGLEPAEQHALERRVLEVVSGEPGVQRAALDIFGPHGSQHVGRVGLPSAAGDASLPRVYLWQASPGWFELFGLEAVSGRTFEDADWRIPSTGAAVLTASLAERLFGSTQAVGRSIWVQGATPAERHVVGVVRDYTSLLSVVAESVEDALRPSGPTDAVFLPHGDVQLRQVTVFAKTTPSAPDVPERVQQAIESVVADGPSPEPYLLSDRVERIHREERLLGRLLLVLAGLGALMSGVGLFGAVYYTVSSRKQELGIRVALGADAARILRLVARSAAVIVGVGLAAGLLVAYPISMALQARLFGLEPLDVTSYALAAGALGLVALLACLAPAREALGTDPAAVLRQE